MGGPVSSASPTNHRGPLRRLHCGCQHGLSDVPTPLLAPPVVIATHLLFLPANLPFVPFATLERLHSCAFLLACCTARRDEVDVGLVERLGAVWPVVGFVKVEYMMWNPPALPFLGMLLKRRALAPPPSSLTCFPDAEDGPLAVTGFSEDADTGSVHVNMSPLIRPSEYIKGLMSPKNGV